MTHAEKLQRMYRHMAALGVSPNTAAPPAWRLLWRLGFDVPPPLFLGFWPLAISMGTVFGVLWGVSMWLLMWARQGVPVSLALAVAVGAGVMFGLLMAAWLRRAARSYALPLWADYSGQPS